MERVKSMLKAGHKVAPGRQSTSTTDDSALTSKPATKTQFKDVQNDLQPKKQRAERPTVVFLEGSRQRKNLAYHDEKIYELLKLRKVVQINYKERDATPKSLTETDLVDVEEHFEEDKKKRRTSIWDQLTVNTFETRKFSSINDKTLNRSIVAEVPDMDDIVAEVIDRTDSTELLDIESTLRNIKDDRKDHPSAKKPKQFIKLQLTETDDIVLFECASLTVPKGTEEGDFVEKYNADYEYITKGAGKNRRTSEAEVQTENLLVKSRSANTERIKKEEKGSFVSNFEMFDTYAELERSTTTVNLEDNSNRKFEVTTYSRKGMDNIDELLSKNENFHLSSMILQRLLSGNVYRERQKRFRNMVMPDPLDLNVKYLYRLETLWCYKSSETMGKDVVDMSWCQDNGDLLAVAYGVYNYRDSKHRISGAVLIWSIKNPVNPERRYRYKLPVTAVCFSQMSPQLLAVALYDGTIEVIDITENRAIDQYTVVARSERKSSPGFEPIWQVQWIQMKEVEYILTASQDGRIMKFKISSGPYLVGYPQLRLDRVEGTVEALSIEHKKTFIEADRHPQALCLQKHPTTPETYLVGTDEGCVHICSTNFPHQHIGVLQVHNSGVYSIDFSPFSPKIFLTAGSDWTIRIWIENIFEPIMELADGFGAIHCAYWSPVHSTIIASCTQNAVQIWDLRRKNQKPASIRTFDNKQLTVIKFSSCGRSLIVGDNEGNTHVCGLEDFPFAPHYQYDELQKALYHSLTNKQDLEKQIKQLGYLGFESAKRGPKN